MSKKILSALLVLTLLVTSVCFMGISVNAEETTWAIGDRPYAVAGGRQEPVVVSAEEGEFYDDFVVNYKLQFDNFTTVNSNGFQLNNSSTSSVSNNNEEVYVAMELTEPDSEGVNEYAYGGTGKSIKVNTGITNGVTRMGKDGKNVFYNAIRNNSATFDCSSYASLDDIAIAFWVKTEGPAQYCSAFRDTTTGNAQRIFSDPINIAEAGEYIIVIPLQNFYVGNTSYVKTADISTFIISHLEILFKAAGVEAGETVNMYFDNIGIYEVMPNMKKATHTAAAVVKDNLDDYTDETLDHIVTMDSARGNWNAYANTLSLAEHNNGKALQNSVANYQNTSNRIYTSLVSGQSYVLDLVGKDGTNLGKNGTLAFWAKASRATSIVVKTNNNSGSAWISSEEIIIPAGESIVKIPLSVYYEQDANFKQIKKLHIDFHGISATTNTIGGTAGTFMIDDIAVEPTVVAGDANGDKVCNAIDIVRVKKVVAAATVYADAPLADIYPDSKLNAYDVAVLRSFLLGDISSLPENVALIEEDSFVEVAINSSKWVNKEISKQYTQVSTETEALYHYSDSEDTTALKVEYTNLDSNWQNYYTNFYLDQILKLNNEEPYNFGSDSVFAFWVYSDQSVNIRINYRDRGIASGATAESNLSCTKTVTVPAGESIIELDMAELAPDGSVPNYQQVYQLQFYVYKNSDSAYTSGELYLDHFGFYDKDTTNDIPAIAE